MTLKKNKRIMLVLLIVILTVVVGYLALNTYKKELFMSGLLPNEMQSTLNDTLDHYRQSVSDTQLLSDRMYKQHREIGNPHIIDSSTKPVNLCYMDTQQPTPFH